MSQQPTFHITKEHFVGVINSLREQFQKDKASAEAFGQIFNTNDAGFYDNSSLINAIFSFLHEVFPKDDDGHCEIQFYCYTLNFGKNGEEYESPEELFDRLTTGKGILSQIENGPVYTETDEEMCKAIRTVLSDIGYPVAPEDAFLQDESGQFLNKVIKCKVEKFTAVFNEPHNLRELDPVIMNFPDRRGFFITYVHEIKSETEITISNGPDVASEHSYYLAEIPKANTFFIDESGQFHVHNTIGYGIDPISIDSKTCGSLSGKPSPDETV